MQELLVLHGAIGSRSQLQALIQALENNYKVHSLNFTGHGGEKIPAADFSIKLFSEQVLEYINKNNPGNINIFGYSMGGYVAMWLAKHHPGKINKIITLATKFHWDPAVASNEIKFLDPDKIEQKLPAFADELQKRHAPQDWKLVLEKTRSMLIAMGEKNPLELNDYKAISNPCLLLLGDRDKMITVKETIDVYKQLPKSEFGVLPATPHPIEQADVSVLKFFIERFIEK